MPRAIGLISLVEFTSVRRADTVPSRRATRSDLHEHELLSVVRSAYERLPYRYRCRDPILRQFCPLPNYVTCRQFVAEHAPER